MRTDLAGNGPDAVALVLIGDELLLGNVLDTNAAWLGQRLRSAGLRVVASMHVPDDADAIARAAQQAAEMAPSVVLTGGLGPTSDDVTREALAVATGGYLRIDETAALSVAAWFTARGRPVPPAALRMAQVPTPGRLLGNPKGSAPGVRVDYRSSVLYAVPGVPREMMAMIEADVLPDLLTRAGTLPATEVRTLRVAVLGETWVASQLAEVEARIDADESSSLAYLASPGEVLVRFTVVRPSARTAREALDGYVALASAALGPAVSGYDDETPAATLIRLLAEGGLTLATAESLTGGSVGAALTSVPGSSRVYRGGVVAYAVDLKADLLDVGPEVLSFHGAVSAQAALAMARGARARLDCNFGVATTGVAGPGSQEGHEPGTAYVAVAGPDQDRVRSLQLRGDRDAVRTQVVAHALDLTRRLLIPWPE